MRLLLAATAFIAFVSQVAFAADQEVMSPSPDEKIVATIIDDLGAESFDVRKAASDRLKEFGPSVVPMLQKYVDHDEPEIKARVNGVIKSFAFMSQGAIISTVVKGGRAEAMGMKMGDVIVKIDEVDINLHTDVAPVTADQKEHTWYIWRAGALRTFQVAPGLIGVFFSNWDINKGGNDHARGLAALDAAKPDYNEAYHRLRAAFELGMNDSAAMELLTTLATRNLDHELAVTAYRLTKPSCRFTHNYKDTGLMGKGAWLPIEGAHTSELLRRYRGEQFSIHLYHELEDWFARNGHNGPLAAQLVAKPWPHTQGSADNLLYHDISRMIVWSHQRRFEDVLAVWDNRAKPQSQSQNRISLAQIAAVHAGQSARAVQIGLEQLALDKPVRDVTPNTALNGFALAAAVGDKDSTDKFLRGIEILPADTKAELPTLYSADALNHPEAAKLLRQWLATQPRPAKPTQFEQIALAQLVSDPTSTLADFDAFTKGHEIGQQFAAYDVTQLTGLVRFGQFDRAKAAIETIERVYKAEANAGFYAKRAIAFAEKQAAELAGPLKPLQGLIHIQPDRRGKTWVLRYDGQVFSVTSQGKLEQFEGLPTPPAPVTLDYAHLAVSPTTVAVVYPFGRKKLLQSKGECLELAYVLDQKTNRWVSTMEFQGTIDFASRPDLVRLIAAQKVAQTYPALPGGFHRLQVDLSLGFGFHWFEGDLLMYVDGKTKQITDLSAEIGRQSGLNRAAAVYAPLDVKAAQPLLPSECGLWIFDPATKKLERVVLGLPDENVMVRELPRDRYQHPKGEILIGVVPQQGGKVFAVHSKTRNVTPTTGYCGLGPTDWYDTHRGKLRDPQGSIYAQYLAKQKVPGK